MGFDGRPIDRVAQDQIEGWMSALQPTRDKPTAVKYRDTIIVYWREGDTWVAREFGRPDLMPISAEVSAAIESDQQHARNKLLD